MVKLEGLWYEIDFTEPYSGTWSDSIRLRSVDLSGDVIVDKFLNQSMMNVEIGTNEKGETYKSYNSYGTEKIDLPIGSTATDDKIIDSFGNVL